MHPHIVRPARRQHGFVLVVALILLLVLTVLGLAAAMSTSLQERMAGNSHNRDMAFQSAEAGLVAGETCVQLGLPKCSTFSLSTTGGNGAYFFDAANPPATALWNQPNFWSTAANYLNYSALYPANIPNVAAQPMLTIEKLPAAIPAGYGLSSSQYGSAPAPKMYRITSLGTGGSRDATVLLQAIYLQP